jgi:hypothetical protein
MERGYDEVSRKLFRLALVFTVGVLVLLAVAIGVSLFTAVPVFAETVKVDARASGKRKRGAFYMSTTPTKNWPRPASPR